MAVSIKEYPGLSVKYALQKYQILRSKRESPIHLDGSRFVRASHVLWVDLAH